jgi:outer membrane immunogenic protein
MKRILLATTGVIALAMSMQAANAADLPRKAPPAPVVAPIPYYNWTGFYIGGMVGGAWSSIDVDFLPLFPFSVGRTSSGWLLGGQTGFNWQVGQWVFGIEGDIGWTNSDNSAFVLGTPAIVRTELDWVATLTGRIGYAWDRWMLYGKGGVAWANTNFGTNFFTFPFMTESDKTRTGWVLGVGLEYAFWNNWTAKLEYNYMDFGSNDFPVGLAPFVSHVDANVQTVKFGINYKFGGWGSY